MILSCVVCDFCVLQHFTLLLSYVLKNISDWVSIPLFLFLPCWGLFSLVASFWEDATREVVVFILTSVIFCEIVEWFGWESLISPFFFIGRFLMFNPFLSLISLFHTPFRFLFLCFFTTCAFWYATEIGFFDLDLDLGGPTWVGCCGTLPTSIVVVEIEKVVGIREDGKLTIVHSLPFLPSYMIGKY